MHFSSETEAGRQAPQRVACLGAHADGWSLVVATSEGSSPKLLCAEHLNAGDKDGVRRLMQKHSVDRLVRVIPMGQAVVRCVTLPSGEQAGASAAVHLMAEAQLPAHIEPHRRAGGLFPMRPNDETRSAMLAGWVSQDVPERVMPEDDDETWIPAGASLGWLLAADADAPSAWGAITHRDGSSCVGAITDEGTRVRSGRLGDPSAAIAEMHHGAAIAGGRSSGFDERTVEALRTMAPTSGVGPEWLDRHALTVGGAIAGLHSNPLAGLLAEPPRYHYTPAQRTALTLADAKRTRSLIILGLLLIFIAPVALLYARNETLKVKLERAREAAGAEAQAEVDELVRNAEFSKALRERAVPATKVMGAVADAMPIGDDAENALGVQIETIDITAEGITIKGEASSRAAAQAFVGALNRKQIFGAVPPADVKDNDRGGSTFTVNARLQRIESAFQLSGDFIDEPFAVRLYGEDARGYDYASVTNMGQAGTSSRGSSSGSRPSSGARERTARFDDNSSEQQGADPVPEVLGEEKINQMDANEARTAFIERRTASRRADIDDETKRLLEEDADLLRRRLQALRGGG